MVALIISPLYFFSMSIFIIFILTTMLPSSNGDDKRYYEKCSSNITCGKLQNLGYPFWGLGRPKYCGHPKLQLRCPNNQTEDYPILEFDDAYFFNVHNIYTTPLKMTIQLQDIPKNNSCPFRSNSSKYFGEVFQFSQSVVNMYLFHNCRTHYKPANIRGSIKCTFEQKNITAYYIPNPKDEQYKHCGYQVLTVHVLSEDLNLINLGEQQLSDALKQGFEVDYLYSSACFTCQHFGGICGSSSDKEFACFPSDHNSGQWKLIVGLAIPGAFFVLIALNTVLCCCTKPKFQLPMLLSRRLRSDPLYSEIENGSFFCGIPVFSYSELQEATYNFNVTQELGHGGFGIVYYGKLRDGREVAVKRLYEKNYKQIGQFMNEIEIFTRLRHHNLVKLYGCTSRHSQELLLVYEFISNGTLADHLHGDLLGSGTLSWCMRMKIAIETASALSYLHASDVIHRDVKTNNILLDNNFSVKVADFGLSRLFPFDATHVSTAPQGTPGYLDPDYYKCYQVTNKSDIYSFGVVLVELMSSLPAVDISRQEDEVNLSDYAMKRIQHGKLSELVDQKLGFESDVKVKRMITLVAELAFQCLQQDKELRPSMDEVLEVLKHIESIDYESLEITDHSRATSKRSSMPVVNDVHTMPTFEEASTFTKLCNGELV